MAFRIIHTCTGCTACVKVCPTQAITGQRKQQHVIAPAVCIECGACGLICPAMAVLDGSGEPCPFIRRSQWPKPVVIEETCVSCNACLQACPVDVLGAKPPAVPRPGWPRHPGEEPEFVVPHLIPYLRDEKNCIGCAFCEESCPVEAVSMRVAEKTSAAA